jgi:hypothetical protein
LPRYASQKKWIGVFLSYSKKLRTTQIEIYYAEDFINELISSSVQNPGKDSNRSSGVAEELAAAQADARTIMEGDLINLNTTSPAATVALGFMYLKSGKRRVAEIFHIPSTYTGQGLVLYVTLLLDPTICSFRFNLRITPLQPPTPVPSGIDEKSNSLG